MKWLKYLDILYLVKMLHDTPVAGIMSSFADVIKHAAQNYPKTDQDAYLYGTAGFRMKFVHFF